MNPTRRYKNEYKYDEFESNGFRSLERAPTYVEDENGLMNFYKTISIYPEVIPSPEPKEFIS